MIRAALRLVLAVVIVVLLSKTFVAIGVVTPVVVNGSSMAPSLSGAHTLCTCKHCQLAFRIGADQLPTDGNFVCQRCGALVQVEDGAARQGETIRVNRLASPRRWDIVVARQPDAADTLCIKRVLGLPGEVLTFEQGDLFADGRRVVKSLSAQRRLRVALPSPAAPSAEGWTIRSRAPTFITDDLPHNQRVRRRLNRVGDLMLTTYVRLGPDASITLSISAGRELVEATLTPEQATLTRASADDKTKPQRRPIRFVSGEVTLSTFDRQALLAADDRVLACLPLPDTFYRTMTARPPEFALTLTDESAEATPPQLWRDVFYEIRPIDKIPPYRLGPKEWLLIGDNQAISHDSRNWQPAGVPNRLLMGRVAEPR